MRFAWIAGVALAAMTAAPASAEIVYQRGIDKAPETLDPQRAATFAETPILLDLFEGLVTVDGEGKPVPGAAESWTISPDGRVYTFTLRRGLRWSNGDALRAADFVASFKRLFDPATGATEAGPLLVIENADAIAQGSKKTETLGVKAIDATTLEITLERPTPTFIARLALPVALPVNVPAIKRLGADFGTTGKIVSNGPYRLAAVDRQDGYVLAKNPRFRDVGTIAIDSVVYRSFADAAGCVDAYRKGGVQSCNDVPTDKLRDLKGEFGAALRIAPFAGTYYLAINMAKKPFDNPKVREALSISIDRDLLARTSWSGGMIATDTLVPGGLLGRALTPKEPIDKQRDAARKLLADAGVTAAKPLKLSIRVGTGAAHEETARLIAKDWKAIGVDAGIATEANAAHFARLRDGGDFDIARAGWIADEADPIDLLTVLRSDNVRFNYPRYKNVDYDKLLDQASMEMDTAKRSKLLEDAEALVERDVPVIPVLEYSTLSLVSPALSGWSDNITNLHPTRFLALSQ